MEEYFIIFDNVADGLKALPEEYKVEAYEALFDFSRTGVMPDGLSPVVFSLMLVMKCSIEKGYEYRQKRKAESEAKRAAGRAGGLQRVANASGKTQANSSSAQAELKQSLSSAQAELKQSQAPFSISPSISISTSKEQDKNTSKERDIRERKEPSYEDGTEDDFPKALPASGPKTDMELFLEKHPEIVRDTCSPLLADIDWKRVGEEWDNSIFLKTTPSIRALSWILKSWQKILNGNYRDKEEDLFRASGNGAARSHDDWNGDVSTFLD